MKFKVETQILNQAIAIVAKAANSKAGLDIRKGIYLSVKDNELKIVAQNETYYISKQIADIKEVKEEGYCVAPKILVDIISKITDEEISVDVTNNVCVIESENSLFKLNCYSTEECDYDLQQFDLEEPTFTINVKDFKDIISTTIVCINATQQKPILEGVNISIKDNKLIAVSTDAYRLARIEKDINCKQELNVTIPYDTINELLKYNYKDNEIKVFIEDKRCIFAYDSFIFSSRLLEGKYPDTDKLIPNEFNLEIDINAKKVVHAADLANLFKNTSEEIIIFTLKNNFIEIKSKDSELGTGKEVLATNNVKAINDSYNNFEIALNAGHLISAINNFKSEELTLKFISNVKQFLCVSKDEPNKLQLLLPIRLDN